LTPIALRASFSVCSSGRTKTDSTETGEYYNRLVDTYRTASGVRQRTLCNLGNGFVIPPEQWKALTQRIEQIVLGRQDMLPPQIPEVEREAQNIAALLLKKYAGSHLLLSPEKETSSTLQSSSANAHDRDDSSGKTDGCSVDLNSLALMNSRSIGGEAVALSALR